MPLIKTVAYVHLVHVKVCFLLVCSYTLRTYAGSSPQTGPEDLRLSLGYFEYHSDGRHWKKSNSTVTVNEVVNQKFILDSVENS